MQTIEDIIELPLLIKGNPTVYNRNLHVLNAAVICSKTPVN